MDWFSEDVAVLKTAELPPDDTYVFPVTFAQQRMWFLNRLQPGSSSYNSPWSLRLSGNLRVESLERSLGEILRRHEVLRTTFSVREGEPVQVVAPWTGFRLPLRNLTGSETPLEEARQIAIDYARQSMDLEKGPLMRAELLCLGPGDHVLLVLIHHILFDGWSRRVFAGEMADLYNAFSVGERSPLPELNLQYGDFAVWQRKFLSGAAMQPQLEYWKRQLEGAPLVLDLPVDRLRPAIAAYRGARWKTSIPGALLEQLRELSRQESATLFMTLLAAFNLVLSRYTGQKDILVGTPVAGRNRVEIESLIGLFVNSLALRTDLGGEPTFRELIARVRETTLAAYARQDLPFERLVEELLVERDLSMNPVFQVMLVLQNIPGRAKRLDGISTSVFTGEAGTSKMDLMLFAIERPHELELAFEYNTDLFDEATIVRLEGHFRAVLTSVAENPGRSIEDYEILSPEEREQILRGWNRTEAPYRRDATLHQLFEEQAGAAPDNIALVAGDERLTYSDLNRRANQLAHRFSAHGCGPGTLAAICLNRTADLLAGLLGILKTGAAYLPLDPEFPRDRLAYILEDSGSRLLISTDALLESLPAFAGETILLDGSDRHSEDRFNENPPPAAEPEDAAYVLYTSGSTGLPKGVEVTHRNVVNFLESMRREPGIDAGDTLLAVTTLSFDIAGLELFLPLIAGARVVLASRDQARDASSLLQLMERWNVSILQATPVTWWMLIEAGWTGSPRLKALCGGEALPSDLAGQLLGLCGELWNMYGPTETTIWSSIFKVETKPAGIAPIGRPIANTSMYVLDGRGRPQPAGVAGELYIGGDGVCRGYWRRPELTAERFVVDPFRPGFLMYRTGDLAKFLPNGNLHFLGRADFQVKLRGFRIELGEIEAVLDRHPLVSQSVVLLREDDPGLPRLVAYIVPADEPASGAGSGELAGEQVSQWAMTWDASYSGGANVEDATLNLSGWNSSYTGEPIPREEMRLWVDATVARILALQPRAIWEIGCGTGLLLFRLAPEVERYHGTDVAEAALTVIRGQLAKPDFQLPQVTLAQRPAHEPVSGSGADRFDLVLLNSVIQYFPNVDYLMEVVARAIDSVPVEGAVFIGDVRNFRLLKEFHTSIQWFQAPDSQSREEFLQRARKEAAEEGELTVDPEFFLALRAHFPRIGRVEIQLKRGFERNEMTRFRYDVILHIGKQAAFAATPAPLDWSALGLTLPKLRRLLRETQPEILVLSGVPDARLMPDAEIARLSEQDADAFTLGELRARFNFLPAAEACEPEDLWAFENEFPYRLEIRPSFQSNGYCDVMFRRKGQGSDFNENLHARFPERAGPPVPWNRYANNPLRRKIAAAVIPRVREWLSGKVPEYMLPYAFVLLESLPLSPNGKVNRRALPAPEAEGAAPLAYLEPRTEIERGVAEIWSGVLRQSRIGVGDNFFILGGHSLLAAQVISRLKQRFRVELPLRALFEAPCLGELAVRIENLVREEPPKDQLSLSPIPRTGPIPLSFTQQRLWFLDRMEPGNSAYNIAWGVRLEGELNSAALEEGINAVLRRHEALRTHFEIQEGEPVQVIAPWSRFTLPVTDLSTLDVAEREPAGRCLAKAEAQRPFHLDTGPVFRAHLFRLSGSGHILVVTAHHIVTDGWSVGVFRDELQGFYEAFLTGNAFVPPILPVQYADYAVWQRTTLAGEQFGEQLSYWKRNLSGIPSLLELPVDRPRPAIRTFSGATRTAMLPLSLLDDLRDLSLREGVTLYMTLLGAFSVLLSRYSGQDDIVVGSPIAGRRHIEVERLIGFFVNTLVLRNSLSGNPPFREFLKRVRETSLGAEAHQDIPFEKLVEELQPERNPGRQPLFQVMFALQNVPAGTRNWPELNAEPFPLKNEQAKFDLTLMAAETSSGLRLQLEYSTALFDASTMDRLLGHFEVLLAGIVSRPETPVADLPLLTAAEERLILVDWNDTRRPYPPLCIHELFRERATHSPDAVAVIDGGRRVTYGELDALSDRLAAHLRALGVRPEIRVGICVDRSVEMTAGLLGILKAGGAYVPLDPSFPAERLAFLIGNAELSMIVTVSQLADQLPDRRPLVFLDRQETWTDDATPEATPNQDNLAYVMYTSGSTGKPKGVETPHRAVVRLLFGVDYARFGPEQVILQAATLSFDASTLEIWGALLHGATLVIYPERVPSIQLLGELILKHRVSFLWLTSSLFNWIVDQAPEILAGVSRIMAGGEALSGPHVRRALQLLPATQLVNGYGPTETTTFALCYQIPSNVSEPIPIGRPIANTTAYVLDRNGRLCPAGIPGELFIGGDGLARGYLEAPALTEQKFLTRVLGDCSERLYATGDRVRFLPNGLIEYLGRFDDQVKIRGFRIEPGEVEAVLGLHPGVQTCSVIVRSDAPGFEKRLAAYVVASSAIDSAALRAWLAERMPDYMVPAAIVFLDALPFSQNGKVDRKLLPSPDSAADARVFTAPRTATEEAIAALWAEMLKVERVGVHDNFFELGGHSLLAVQVFANMERITGKKLSLNILFRCPTVAGIAALIPEREPVAQASSVKPCRVEGSKRPIFAVHGIGGTVLTFRNVVANLPNDRPVYALEAFGNNRSWRNLEELATLYVGDLLAFQPLGPYHFIGSSFGGMVIFEMARQLEKLGHTVGLLGMLDSANMGRRNVLTRKQRAEDRSRFFLKRTLMHVRRFKDRKLQAWPRYLAGRILAIGRLLQSSVWRFVYRYYRAPDKLPAPLLNMKRVYESAGLNYLPKTYAGAITLFLAADQHRRNAAETQLGWAGWASGGVRVIEVPGDHNSMVQEPNVRVLAAEIAKCLDTSAE